MTNSLNKYFQYHINNARCWEIDTQTDFAVWFAKRSGLDQETLCWFTFLNGLCEFSPCALVFFKVLPDWRTFKREDVERLTRNHFLVNAHPFECRWAYYKLFEILTLFRNFVNANGGDLLRLVKRCAYGKTRQERYANFERNFKLNCVGRYVNLLWTELLYYINGIDFEATLDVRDNYSVRSGLVYALGLENRFKCNKRGVDPTDAEWRTLTNGLNYIVQNIRRMPINPRHKTMWAIETTLCTFNKFNHGRRWLGYYKKRQGDQRHLVERLTKDMGLGIDWASFYDGYMSQWGRWDNNYNYNLDFGGK